MTDWTEVTRFFNSVIEESTDNKLSVDQTLLRVQIYSPALDQTLNVTIPSRKVDDFMKNLPLFEARVWNGTQFCDQCGGPYEGWLEQYNGHWDTCPNRRN